jgi:glycine cleavage system aminomethyltransferase T
VSVGTVFFPREAALNAHLAWGEWSGYHSAAVYADFHDIEYNAIREAAGVVDVSPLSTLGALCVAAVEDPETARSLFRELMAWGLSMTLVGALLSQLLAGPLARL